MRKETKQKNKNKSKKAVYFKRSKAAAAILQTNFYNVNYWSARTMFLSHLVSTSVKDTKPHI